MHSRALTVVVVAAFAAALGGCSTTSPTGMIDDEKLGEASRQTFAAQVIDPEPVYSAAPETSGEHAAQAVDRYRKGTVKMPERVRSAGSGRNN
jgi:type IV pilus biogenesis protein CpaD/CtpE